MDEPLFRIEGELALPSPDTRGPWDPAAQHAGPPAALLGRAMEQLGGDGPGLITRFTLEVLRPVPLAPLRVTAAVERSGRRVQLLRGSIRAGEVEVATARAVRIRRAEVALPELAAAAGPPLGPDDSVPHQPLGAGRAFHETGVEMRFARGSFVEPGPVAVWIRLRHPLLAGEEPSPLQRTLAAADFGNGVSAVLDWQRHLFINPDLSVHLVRPPSGEWICLDAESWIDPGGTGLARSVLHDTAGPFGYALQTLLVDRRGTG